MEASESKQKSRDSKGNSLTLIPRWKSDIPGKWLNLRHLPEKTPTNIGFQPQITPSVVSLNKLSGALILVRRSENSPERKDPPEFPNAFLPLAAASDRRRDRVLPAGLPERLQRIPHSRTLFMLTARADDICKLTADILSTCWSVS